MPENKGGAEEKEERKEYEKEEGSDEEDVKDSGGSSNSDEDEDCEEEDGTGKDSDLDEGGGLFSPRSTCMHNRQATEQRQTKVGVHVGTQCDSPNGKLRAKTKHASVQTHRVCFRDALSQGRDPTWGELWDEVKGWRCWGTYQAHFNRIIFVSGVVRMIIPQTWFPSTGAFSSSPTRTPPQVSPTLSPIYILQANGTNFSFTHVPMQNSSQVGPMHAEFQGPSALGPQPLPSAEQTQGWWGSLAGSSVGEFFQGVWLNQKFGHLYGVLMGEMSAVGGYFRDSASASPAHHVQYPGVPGVPLHPFSNTPNPHPAGLNPMPGNPFSIAQGAAQPLAQYQTQWAQPQLAGRGSIILDGVYLALGARALWRTR